MNSRYLLFGHALKDVAGEGELCGYLVADADDAKAEAFAVGAMHYSFRDAEDPRHRPAMEDDGAPSFGHFLQWTGA